MSLSDLVHGLAVRTLPAAVAPVLVGTALSPRARPSLPGSSGLLGAMFIQVGTNLSNDYSDARRGATPRTASARCA